jgi:hypothetical protein
MSVELNDLAIRLEEGSEFYHLLGRALWAVGHFEYHLVHIIVVVFKSPFNSRDAVENALEKEFEKTLGNLLKEFRRYRELAPDLDRRIDAFKTERDWLCHRIYWQNHTNLFNRQRFELLVSRLEAFKREATELEKILDQIFERWGEDNPISTEEENRRIRAVVDDWKKG